MSTKDEEIEKEIRSKKVDKENLSDYCIILMSLRLPLLENKL